jgi:hypothetical protein
MRYLFGLATCTFLSTSGGRSQAQKPGASQSNVQIKGHILYLEREGAEERAQREKAEARMRKEARELERQRGE